MAGTTTTVAPTTTPAPRVRLTPVISVFDNTITTPFGTTTTPAPTTTVAPS